MWITEHDAIADIQKYDIFELLKEQSEYHKKKMTEQGYEQHFVDYSGTDFTTHEDNEMALCLTVAKESFTDFEKLFYRTNYSDVFRRYANIRAMNFQPIPPEH